ncbi:DUF3944 domain-containing protein [Vibrio sp. CAIM 722]|uniref:DUF3944 domain-containing protein n=1 Tax=Vibrio eleionomae TaxID=2653505 RepID=A0A7X4LJB5_9VIBR|nr:DUF3944 domain-containing protein [Vibrio eleionomae]MZI92972.1 DUF3944 domain-containing protein [Vibrio eleionomae]
MAYRYDADLEFLGQLSSDDLEDLVYSLTHDNDGQPRWTEELTKSVGYNRHHPDHAKYWEDIAAEIQTYGANTVATFFRGGKGVEYKEILVDVCSKLKVNFNKEQDVEMIETHLLMKILEDALDNMDDEELRDFAQAAGVENTSVVTKQTVLMAFQAAFKIGGFKSYQLTLVIVNAVIKALIGRGLSFAGNVALTRAMSILAGPVGWAISGAWTAVDLAGAAYRVTIPAVIQVAVLRQKYRFEQPVKEAKAS